MLIVFSIVDSPPLRVCIKARWVGPYAFNRVMVDLRSPTSLKDVLLVLSGVYGPSTSIESQWIFQNRSRFNGQSLTARGDGTSFLQFGSLSTTPAARWLVCVHTRCRGGRFPTSGVAAWLPPQVIIVFRSLYGLSRISERVNPTGGK